MGMRVRVHNVETLGYSQTSLRDEDAADQGIAAGGDSRLDLLWPYRNPGGAVAAGPKRGKAQGAKRALPE